MPSIIHPLATSCLRIKYQMELQGYLLSAELQGALLFPVAFLAFISIKDVPFLA